MKKMFSVLIVLNFIMTLLLPVTLVLTKICGYTVSLPNFEVTLIITTLPSLLAVIIDICFKPLAENRMVNVLQALTPPFALVNAILLTRWVNPWPSAIICIIYFVCCCILAKRHGKPRIIVAVVTGLSVITLAILLIVSPILMLAGQLLPREKTIKSIMSPDQNHYIKVLDSDGGARGGKTFIDLYENAGIDLFFIKVEKNPKRIWEGEWLAFEKIQIKWNGSECIIIDSDDAA